MNVSGKAQPDVRMRGFAARTTVEAALEWIDAQVHVLEAEVAALDDLHGRVLAEDVKAPMDVPSFDRAAMDGYALRGAETTGASDYNPLTFDVRGYALPGKPHLEVVERGTAVRIMTGAPMPPGADAVVPAEFALERDGRVEIASPFAPAKHVGTRAEDVREGALLFGRGHRLARSGRWSHRIGRHGSRACRAATSGTDHRDRRRDCDSGRAEEAV